MRDVLERGCAMIVTVFRSRLRPGVHDEYLALVERMNALAATMPGYLWHKGFFAEDGERVTIVEFESEEAVRAWRMHPEHVAAQRRGRTEFYSEYHLQTCALLHDMHFTKTAPLAATANA